MTKILIDISGWTGSALIILAYILVSKNRISAQSKIYHTMNIVACVLLILNTVFYGAYPSTVVNIIWIVVGVYYLFRAKSEGSEKY